MTDDDVAVVVTGGRKYDNKPRLHDCLEWVRGELGMDYLLTGGCSGADALADQWASYNGQVHLRVPACWGAHGSHAGPMRNREMLRIAKRLAGTVILLTFPGGRGTANCTQEAHRLGIRVIDESDVPED